jgi:hypothetical protein
MSHSTQVERLAGGVDDPLKGSFDWDDASVGKWATPSALTPGGDEVCVSNNDSLDKVGHSCTLITNGESPLEGEEEDSEVSVVSEDLGVSFCMSSGLNNLIPNK